MQGAPPTLEKIGNQLLRKIGDFEKRLEDLDDEKIANWDDAQGDEDLEKLELQERIIFLEGQQIKILARYEMMRQTLSTVSEQAFGVKQKLRYHKSDAIHNMVKALCQDDLKLPDDADVLQEIAMALKVENRILEKMCPIEKNEAAAIVNIGAAAAQPRAETGVPVSPRGNRPGPSAEAPPADEGNQNLILKNDRIVAGTIPQLLGCLLSKANLDREFEGDFLSTYHSFLSGTLLLQNLSQRFQNSPDKSQQLRVFNIINAWLQCNPLDIRDDPMLRDHMVEFIQTMAGVVSKMQTKKLLTLLEKKISTKVDPPLIHKLPDKEWNLMKFDSRDLARQMTLHDLKLYQLIDPREAMKNPDELLITKRIQKLELWVDRELKKSKKKSLVIKKLVEVIVHCSRLRNFHTTFVLLDAICQADDKKSVMKGIKKIPDLSALTDEQDDYGMYRSIIAERKLAAIPNFKFQMIKLAETKDEPNEIVQNEVKLVNFAKYRPAGQVIQEILFFQKSSYPRIEVESTTMGYIQALP
eukprot:CAMPEP_0201507668 /NCGR_PEP_ID=MMETSP0161_2-20130828/1273_1 /ASSEMBLY_ACC=CAM_ASM_000251 /TAXON_ID=180227 /ORGANISM="Neoparamoeba aestuarina, Strain SoJaBio B1-5/56/2" /LENGTH=525 /DNA_ID=CAMNT_0047902099 /DNA_START=133 /DNA_END=1710 /DNA_ORIENTATION=-